MRKALVQDNFQQNGGAEKVVKSIGQIYSNLDYFSLTDFLTPENRNEILNGKYSNTTFIQKLPNAKKWFRHYLPFYPMAIEQLDFTEYDIIISSSYSVAKGILTNQNQIHICYMHSPVRYAWDLYHQYLKEKNLHKGLKSIPVKWVLHYLRMWDAASANRPDYYIANSNYIAGRIKKIYNKPAHVIYPPVDTSSFSLSSQTENYYFTFSRMVPYKKMDLIVEAFANMPDKKLLVSGDGPEYNKVKSKAGKNVEFLGFLPKHQLIACLQKAKAFVFAAEEDFGIAPVEAQACGVPVIAFGKGGALETIKGSCYELNAVTKDDTGVFYNNQTADDISKAVCFFEKHQEFFTDKEKIRQNSLKFDESVFKQKFEETINSLIKSKY